MKSLSLRRLIGLLAVLTFAFALPLQASMAGSMADCGMVGAAMDQGDGTSGCHESGVPAKAAMNAVCGVTCASFSALPAQTGSSAVESRVVHVRIAARSRLGVVTAPDPFPPKPTVHA